MTFVKRMITAQFPPQLFTGSETYACAYANAPYAGVPLRLQRAVVNDAYHHLALYRCPALRRDEALLQPPWECSRAPTVPGCEEMLYTYASRMEHSAAPKDVAFLATDVVMVQLHTNGGRGVRSVSVTTERAPPHLPTVRYVEIGPRLDWGGPRHDVSGRCTCHATAAQARYLTLHTHNAADKICFDAANRTTCVGKDHPHNAVRPFHVTIPADGEMRLRCRFAHPSRLGVWTTDEMCFAYLLVDRTAPWPIHCWDGERRCFYDA